MDKIFDNLVGLQWLGCVGASFLGVSSLVEFGFSGDAIVPLLLSLLALVTSWIAPQILHELIEINDQLAGRSPELHERLSQKKSS